MSTSKNLDVPPSYIESLHHTSPASHGQTIIDSLTTTRATHIRDTIAAHLLPLIHQRATKGLAKTTIALLPSDIPLSNETPEDNSEFSFHPPSHSKKSQSTNTTTGIDIIGFPDDEQHHIIKLDSDTDRSEFWRIEAVVAELERVLYARLNEGRSNEVSGARVEAEGRQEQGRASSRFRRGLLGGRKSETKVSSDEGRSQLVGQGLQSGSVHVSARVEENSLRFMTPFGLYDTVSAYCVIVRIDVRC